MVPSQNPDGVDIVGDYYRSTIGTPMEGREPPTLYHYYVGHDDNRDWYAFTQPETRATIDSLYTPWDPQIVNDLHQQGSNTSRIFIPPYMDPVEPNIDPILTAATNGLGMSLSLGALRVHQTAKVFTGRQNFRSATADGAALPGREAKGGVLRMAIQQQMPEHAAEKEVTHGPAGAGYCALEFR